MPTFSIAVKPLSLSSGIYNLYSSAFSLKLKQKPPGVNCGFSTYSSRTRSGSKTAWIKTHDRSVGVLSLGRRSSPVCGPWIDGFASHSLVDGVRTARPVYYSREQGGETLSCTISSPSIRQQNADKSADTTQKPGLASVPNYPPTVSRSGSIPSLPKSLSRSHTLQRGNLRRLSGSGSSIIYLNSVHLSRIPKLGRHFQPPTFQPFSSTRDDLDLRKISELAKRLQKSGTNITALVESKVDPQEVWDILIAMQEIILGDSDPVQAGRRAAIRMQIAREAGKAYTWPGGPTKLIRRRVAELRRLLEDDRKSGRNRISPDQKKAFEAMLDSLSNAVQNILLGLRLFFYALAFYFLVLPISRWIIRAGSTQQPEIGNEIDSEMKDDLPLWQQEDESQL